jgi:hypothetical protein
MEASLPRGVPQSLVITSSKENGGKNISFRV